MKNLKKILIVVAMLALLLVSFATVSGAEEEANKGSVAEIEKYITKIEAEFEKTDGNPVNEVTSAYDYIHDPTLVWEGVSETAEYKTAVAKLDKYCVQAADSICPEEKVEQGSINSVTNGVNTVYAFLTKCGPAEETEGYAALKAKITAKNEEVTEYLYALISVPTVEVKTETPEEPAPETPAPAETDSEQTDPEGTTPEEPAPETPAPAPTREDYDAIYSALNTGRVSTKNLFKQLKKCPWVSEEAADKYDAIAQELVDLMLDAYYVFVDSADAKSSSDYFKTVNDIRTVEAFVMNTITAEKMTAISFRRMIDGLEIAEAAVEAQRKELDKLAPFDEYDLGYYMQRYYEPDVKDLGDDISVANAKKAHRTEKVTETIYTGYNEATGAYSTDENTFTKFVCASTDEKIHLYSYIPLSKAKGMSEYGVVFEWDMRVNDQNSNAISLQDEDRVRTENGSAQFANLFDTVTGTDNFIGLKQGEAKTFSVSTLTKEDRDNNKVMDAMVIDVWTHFTITYDPETRVGTLYVNYMPIFEIYHFNYEKLQSQFRFGPSATMGWESGWDLDNIEIYYGTAFRITDKFSSMTTKQQFEYFVNYAHGEDGYETEYLSRNSAYNKAKLMLKEYKAAYGEDTFVKKFNEIDYDNDIKVPAMAQNIKILTEKVANLQKLAINTTNKTRISDTIADINAFVSKNGSLINKADTSDTGYQAQMAIVYSTEADVKKLDYIEAFVAELEKFERATTLSARTRYALAAAEIYAQAEYDIEENRNFVIERNDPVVIAFEKKLNNQVVDLGEGKTGYLQPTDDKGNPTPGYLAEDDPAYIQLFEYYYSFESLLVAREKLENSKNIINAVNSIIGMKGYAATDEFFEANYDAIKPYTLLIRGYINSAKYDESYEGVEEAIEKFLEMDPYFFEKLQLEHIATLEEMLAKYDAVNTFIEKVAVVNSVKAYFDSADTALNNTTITKAVRMRVEDEREQLLKLQGQNEVYENELKGYENSYLDVLNQQTQYFINIINHMDSIVSFSEIEELFDEATVYYYGINLNVEGALEAAEKYADYRAYIASVNESNDAFTMYMKNLTSILNDEEIVGKEKRDELFSTLKSLSTYVDFVDAGDRNIAGGLERYYTELAAYESGISAIDGAIYQANQFANALRTNKLPATVLSVIGRLIND